MKKKGFTLMELLAVIVILAIIVLIAVPMILNVIAKAKKGSVQESVNGYIESIQNEVAVQMLETENTYLDVSCRLSDQTMVCDNGKTIAVKTKGDKLDSFDITFLEKGFIENGKFQKDNYCVTYQRDVGIKFVTCGKYKMDAGEVSFTPIDSDWNVGTVEEALDSIRGVER